MLVINAMNVHQGGGRNLLMSLLDSPHDAGPVFALLDARLAKAVPNRTGLTIRSVAPTVVGRTSAERWLSKTVGPGDTLLCFGNLPPLFGSRGHVVVFLQNRYLIDGSDLGGFPWPARLRLTVERQWLRARAHHADAFIVQTPSMPLQALQSGMLGDRPIHVRPFVAQGADTAVRPAARPAAPGRPHVRFAYVASGEPHKNHRTLLAAWQILARSGLHPALDLTVGPPSTPLAALIGEAAESGLKVRNHGIVPADAVADIYAQADALIFPSTNESFGLPLIEAQARGLPILASELDYVRDVVVPVQSFDPASPISIARAVRRFMGCEEPPVVPLSPAEFIARLAREPLD